MTSDGAGEGTAGSGGRDRVARLEAALDALALRGAIAHDYPPVEELRILLRDEDDVVLVRSAVEEAA